MDSTQFNIANGKLSAGGRPKIESLQEMSVSFIITLQMESENPLVIQKACEELSISWLWVPIRAVNWEVLKNTSAYSRILDGLNTAKQVLAEGHKVFVHCAAGFHRTGFFLYALLRLCGFSIHLTFEAIKIIRPLVMQKAGRHRLDLAEEFFQSIFGKTVLFPYYQDLGIRQGDFLNPEKPVLAFFKVFMNGCLAKIQFCATTFDFYKIVIGGEIYFTVDFEFLWKDERKFEGNGESREDCDLVLTEFLQSSTENPDIYLAGFKSFYDQEFFLRYCPKLSGLLEFRIIDMSWMNHFSVEFSSGSVYEDLRYFMSLKR